MKNRKFNELYLNRRLEEIATSVRMFRDLNLSKIRGSLPRGYSHTPEELISAVIHFLDGGVAKGFVTFGDVRKNSETDYMGIREVMIRMGKSCKYPLG